MQRHTPLRRKTHLRSRSPKKAAQSRDYDRVKAAYLAEHPYCQITIAREGLDESQVLLAIGSLHLENLGSICIGGITVPRAREIHHRNKRTGSRLTDTRWFMSACREAHEWVEQNKQLARSEGYLLPMQADKDGKWANQQALDTQAFMESQIIRKDHGADQP